MSSYDTKIDCMRTDVSRAVYYNGGEQTCAILKLNFPISRPLTVRLLCKPPASHFASHFTARNRSSSSFYLRPFARKRLVAEAKRTQGPILLEFFLSGSLVARIFLFSPWVFSHGPLCPEHSS